LNETPKHSSGQTEAIRSFLQRDWAGLLGCLLIAIAYTVWVVYLSQTQGKLTHDIQYDDVLHFVDAAHLYESYDEHGWTGAALHFIDNPTLAPLSTLGAFLTFLPAGPVDVGPYYLNGVILLLLLWLVWILSARFSLPARVAAVFYLLSIPIAFSAVADFKPNLAASLLTLAALMALAEWTLLRGPATLLPLAAVLAATAILAKPPFFPFVGFTLCLGLGSCVALRRLGGDSWLPPMRWADFALALVLPILLLAPYAWLGGSEVVRMLLEHIAPGGKYQEVWTAGAKGRTDLLYFLTGNGGIMLGGHLAIIAALWACALAGLIKAPRIYVLVLSAVVAFNVIAYLPPTLTAVKHRFTGMLFQLLLILGPVYLLALRYHLATSVKARYGLAACMVAAGLLALTLADPVRGAGGWLYDAEIGKEQRQLVRSILEGVQTSWEGKTPPNLTLFTTGMINSTTLDWVSRSEGYPIHVPSSGNVVTLRNTDYVTRGTDYILAAEPDALGTYQWHPVVREFDYFNSWIEASGRFSKIATFPTSSGGQFLLYRLESREEETREAQ